MKHDQETLTVLVSSDFKRDLRIVAAKRRLSPSELVRHELAKVIQRSIREHQPRASSPAANT